MVIVVWKQSRIGEVCAVDVTIISGGINKQMNDWTEKDTHNILTQNGYKKPANGPSYLRTYAHPEGHKIEIDRNMYKHTKGNGEVSRGHVTNLPFAMRQLHKPKERMMEVELDIYNSKEKNAADDKMVSPGITDRFKKDVAFNSGDYGDVQKKYAPGVTYEGEYDRGIAKMKAALKSREAEDEFRKKYKEPKQPKKGLLKKIFGEEMDLLKSVIAEAQSFDPKYTKHTENPITDCNVCGKGNHVPAKHLGRALGPENNQPIKEEDAKSKRLALGKTAWSLSKKAHESGKKSDHAAALAAHKTALAAHGKKGSTVHKTAILYHSNPPKKKTVQGAPESPAMALNRMSMSHDGSAGRLGESERPLAGFHKWADERQDARTTKQVKRQKELDKWKENTKDMKYSKPKKVNESSPVEPKVIGHFIQHHLPSGKKHRGAMMDTHLRELGVNGRLSTGEKVTKDTILNHWNSSQPKTYKYEWDKETKESEIPGNDKAVKCDECGKLHAPTVPCSAKEVLVGGEVDEMQKMSRSHDDPDSAERHRASLEKSGVKAWVNKGPDNKHNVFWQVKEGEQVKEDFVVEGKSKKKVKLFDKGAHVRAIARNVVGQIPKGSVITTKKDRKPKHKEDYMRESFEQMLRAAEGK